MDSLLNTSGDSKPAAGHSKGGSAVPNSANGAAGGGAAAGDAHVHLTPSRGGAHNADDEAYLQGLYGSQGPLGMADVVQMATDAPMGESGRPSTPKRVFHHPRLRFPHRLQHLAIRHLPLFLVLLELLRC